MNTFKTFVSVLGAFTLFACAPQDAPDTQEQGASERPGGGKADSFDDAPVCAYDVAAVPGGIETSRELQDFVLGGEPYTGGDADTLEDTLQGEMLRTAARDLDILGDDGTLAELFEAADDGVVTVYDLEIEGANYNWVSLYLGDTEVGAIYLHDRLDIEKLTLVGQVSDGDLLGCGEGAPEPAATTCTYDTSEMPGKVSTSSELRDYTLGGEPYTGGDADALESLPQGELILIAMGDLELFDADATLAEVFEGVDDGVVTIYDLEIEGAYYNWVSFYMGDTEVGAIYTGDLDPVLIGKVSDGDIQSCTSTGGSDEPAAPTCDYDQDDYFDVTTSGGLQDYVLGGEPYTGGDAATLESSLQGELILIAMGDLELFDADATLAEVFEGVDDGVITIYDLEVSESNYSWVSFYMGDTEVGGIYYHDRINPETPLLVGQISDGDIVSCLIPVD